MQFFKASIAKKRINKDDDIFDENEETKEHKVSSDKAIVDINILKIKQDEEESNNSDEIKPNETIENMIEIKSTDTKNKEEIRKINIIEKEKKQEGEITIRTWIKFFNYGFGIFGVMLIAVLA